jgi:hypothetical protein
MIPPIRRPQVFGIAAVIAVFLLVELVVGGYGKTPVPSNEAQVTTPR